MDAVKERTANRFDLALLGIKRMKYRLLALSLAQTPAWTFQLQFSRRAVPITRTPSGTHGLSAAGSQTVGNVLCVTRGHAGGSVVLFLRAMWRLRARDPQLLDAPALLVKPLGQYSSCLCSDPYRI